MVMMMMMRAVMAMMLMLSVIVIIVVNAAVMHVAPSSGRSMRHRGAHVGSEPERRRGGRGLTRRARNRSHGAAAKMAARCEWGLKHHVLRDVGS